MGDIGCYLAIAVLGVSASFSFPRWQGEAVNDRRAFVTVVT